MAGRARPDVVPQDWDSAEDANAHRAVAALDPASDAIQTTPPDRERHDATIDGRDHAEPLSADDADDWDDEGDWAETEARHDRTSLDWDDDEPLLSELTSEDRLATLEVRGSLLRQARRFGPTAAFAGAAHVVLFALLFLVAKPPAPIAQQQETPVEIVQEPAPPPPKPEAKAAPAKTAREPEKPVPEKPATAQKDQAPELPKPESPKPESPKPEPPEPSKPEPSKPEPSKLETSKPETAKIEPPKPAAPDETAKTLQSLQEELAALKSQQAALKAESAAHDAPSAALGPLPDSFAAVALPAEAIGGEDNVSYQQVVFSQLAKAKADTKHVVTPGVAQVVFDIDLKGALVSVSLAQPSGNAYLDHEAVAIVRRAAPFPPPPQGALRHFSAAMKLSAQD